MGRDQQDRSIMSSARDHKRPVGIHHRIINRPVQPAERWADHYLAPDQSTVYVRRRLVPHRL
jgi:hypothetical protein